MLVIFRGAIAFVIVALLAAVSGFAEIAALSLNLGWIFFLFGLVFEMQSMVQKGSDRKEST